MIQCLKNHQRRIREIKKVGQDKHWQFVRDLYVPTQSTAIDTSYLTQPVSAHVKPGEA